MGYDSKQDMDLGYCVLTKDGQVGEIVEIAGDELVLVDLNNQSIEICITLADVQHIYIGEGSSILEGDQELVKAIEILVANCNTNTVHCSHCPVDSSNIVYCPCIQSEPSSDLMMFDYNFKGNGDAGKKEFLVDRDTYIDMADKLKHSAGERG